MQHDCPGQVISGICYSCGWVKPYPSEIVLPHLPIYRPLKMPMNSGVKSQVFFRDGYKCLKCGSQDNLTFDHIHPVSKGGKANFENGQTLCGACNLNKGASNTDYRKKR